ncbi:MAG: hypothetical protein N3D73_00440 [Candidatus Diapherotrites archaeon]|nr:hypothetical protein [Candidatus Diapherotrites archaeon]
MIRQILEITEKLLLISVAFLLVVIILLRMHTVLGEIRLDLLKSGDYEWLLYITLFGLIITWLLKKLLVWEIHATLGNPKIKKQYRR